MAKKPAGRSAKRRPAGKKRAKARAKVLVKRVYDPSDDGDGRRILIDGLWPRGIAKARLELDDWVKDLAPSNALRKWYRHDPEKLTEFRRRYRDELKAQREGLAALRQALKGKTVTLLTATKELDLSHATVLRELLTGKS